MFSVVILAAGKGTRMKSSLPKVLHPIGGKPMLQRIIDTVTSLSPRAIHLVYGHGASQLQNTIVAEQLNWCLQEQQLGTGHAVMQAQEHIQDNEDVLILVGDAPLIQASTLDKLIQTKQQADIALLTVSLDDPTGMGRILRQGDNIVGIVEHKDASDEQRQISEINTGMMMMQGSDLKRWLGQLSNDNAQGEYYLTDIIGIAASEGKRIQSAQADSAIEVEGVNNRVQLARLERALQQRNAETLMNQGLTLFDPKRFDLRGELIAGQDVVIDVNVVIEGKVTLGNKVYVGPNCVLKDCEIQAGSHIDAYTHIDSAKVGADCQIGPYARLRPGSELKDKAKVGNFVEIKNTVLGTGAKANHLSYLGDSQVGANANIGAGTITCNYDGVNKSKTHIGDNAFIGSNSSLVAPVTVGINATVGAGSVINKDVEDDKLAIARAKQRTIEGWQRPTKR